MSNVDLAQGHPAVLPETLVKGSARGQAPEISFSLELLAEALDRVAQRCPQVPLLAIPWLHIKHPIHPVQEELIQRPQGGRQDHGLGAGRVAGCLGRFLLSLGYAAYFMFRILQVHLRYAPTLRRLRKFPFGIIAKTWRFESAEGDDFYYGDLQRRLKARSVRMLLLYGYPQGKSWRSALPPSVNEDGELPELCLASPLDPFRSAWRQLRTSFRLMDLAKTERGLARTIARRAAWDCLSFANLLNVLFYEVSRRAVTIWRPEAFLTFYEGHAWERCTWAGVKAADPYCKIVGYQHTILLPHQLTLYRPESGSFLTVKPDVVLCLGPRPQNILAPSHPRSQVLSFGSFRKSVRVTAKIRPEPNRRTVLVLPEAHKEEMKLMFDTAMRAALQMSEHRFILRCHPILPSPLEQVAPTLERDPASLPNVEFCSGRSVEEDFSRSSVVLYRGSSSVLYAILAGLKPVYLHDEILHDLDPLYELKEWKEKVSSVGGLVEFLRAYAGTKSDDLLVEWEAARAFVGSYTGSVEQSSVEALLEAVVG